MNTDRKKDTNWIPVERELPDVDEDGYSDYILISLENSNLPCIGVYVADEEGGAFHDGDDERTLASYGFMVNAWMPLPENFRKKEEE